MREPVVNYVKDIIQRYQFEEPVLDTCSGWEPNYYQPLFPGKKFLKQDMRDFDPPCIDILCSITDMQPIADNSIGLVLNLEALQHIDYPQKAIDEIYRILQPNGMVILSTHMYWPIMYHPRDYWRFCPHGLELMLSKFKILDFTMEGDEHHPTGLWITAQKSADTPNLGKLPPARHARIATNWAWYWLIKRPLEKFFHLEIKRLTPESKIIPFR
ncbi:MAG: class I SAM-dependent methyltransferase [Candidatus Schekmanbacteria bacterium]|nr:class I SAM-dependent methyltransferase [Candidatus Schekmanbacteria bacterium]